MVYPTYTKLYSIIAELILFPREIEKKVLPAHVMAITCVEVTPSF